MSTSDTVHRINGGHHSASYEVLRAALAAGAVRKGPISLEWDLAYKCERPVYVPIKSLPNPTGAKEYEFPDAHAIYMDMYVPCRACGPCLKRRQWIWTSRAENEIKHAPRTWFGTLTLSPEWQYRALCEYDARANERAGHKAVGTDDFAQRHSVISKWITKWLKRVRKRTGSPFRYLLVSELHKSGLPHYHILLHELDRLIPVPKAALEETWPYGFTRFKLVDSSTAGKTGRYVAKYLTKSRAARVRASLGYGHHAGHGLVP